ncbi:MAG: type III secretion system outer membrane ring subunit SctC [Deltaproteobacteria bacterium]|nr:type III secretion system outer membrane ring subunit SctC [Deltaproteobacteria bacterium]
MLRKNVSDSSTLFPLAFALFLFALLLAFFPADTVQAASLKDLRKAYTHTSQQEPLTTLLSDFAISQGYSAAFTTQVVGVVSGDFSNLAPASFLAAMRSGYGVEAYILGSTIYFFHQSERQREVLRIYSMPPSEMRGSLLRMGVLSEDLPSDTSKKERLLFIEGPAGYVSSLVTSIRTMEDMQMNEQAIRVFPLKHAWADDTTVENATGTTTIPGVASVLRAIATGQPSPSVRTLHRSDSITLMGSGLIGRRETQAEPVQPQATSGANIIAEPRSNSVIVTDTQSRMPYYEAVIAELDKPLDLVEIHAAIVDIDASYSRNLGIRWGGTRNQGDFSGSTGSTGAPGASMGGADAAGFALSTIYNTALNTFFADIRALEERGAGAMLSRPSVLTMDNVQASLEYTTTFYIKLEGYETVDAIPVTSGTTLKVTPRILRMPDDLPSRLALNIVISDGADPTATPQTSWVNEIPPVTKVTINTQATVAEGQSLLLGGFYYERRSDDKAGTPGLMNIPVFGNLFGQTGADVQRMERLILISPRIIRYDSLEAPTPIPDRVEEQRFALSPTAGDYALRDDFYEVAPTSSGCSRSVVRPEPIRKPADAPAAEPVKAPIAEPGLEPIQEAS